MRQIVFYLSVFISMFLLQSCLSTTPSEDSFNNVSTISYSNDNSGSPELLYDFSNNETFGSFIQKFSLDSLFQIRRIQFPLKVNLLNEDLGEIQSWKEEKNWRRLVIEETEDYSMTFYTNRKGEEGFVEFRGIENGIAITYNFKLQEGEWYLVEMTDLST